MVRPGPRGASRPNHHILKRGPLPTAQEPPPPPPPPSAWLQPSGAASVPPFPELSLSELHTELPPPDSLPEAARLRDLLRRLVLSAYNSWSDWAGPGSGTSGSQQRSHILGAVADSLAEWEQAAGRALDVGGIQLAPDVAAARAEGSLARLTAQRDALLAEEAAWHALQAAAAAEDETAAAADASARDGEEGADIGVPAPAEAAAVATALQDVARGSCLGALRAAVEAAQLRLELHADGVAALVTSADLLASRAEAAAAQLARGLAQAEMLALAAPQEAAGSPRALLRALTAV